MKKYDSDELQRIADDMKQRGILREFADDRLERMGKNHVCPVCKSGTGKNHSPAFSIEPKGERWKCFSCEAGGDVYDLAGILDGTEDFIEQVEIVAGFAGVPMPGQQAGGFQAKRGERQKKEEGQPDYSQGRERQRLYIAESQRRLQEVIAGGDKEPLEYLLQRGFTPDEIARFGFGYDPDAGGAKDDGGNWCKRGRIVIPWKGSDYYHIDRSIDPAAKDRKYSKPKADEVGAQPLHNPDALEKDGVFIVEGVLDAFALEAMGQNAIALAGTAYEPTLKAIASRGYKGVVVLMMDGDDTGREKQAEAAKLADDLRLSHYEADFMGENGYKDACEALAANRESAARVLEGVKAAAKAKADEDAKQAEREAMAALKIQDPAEIAAAIVACQGYEPPTPTGFHGLDNVLNGGLRSGLHVLGAVSSAGKTTLIVQMADFIAASGRPVLFVTIEQSGREIVAKSLSRLMAQRDYTSISLWEMSSEKYRYLWNDDKTNALYDAFGEYAERIAPNLVVMAADEQPTVNDVKAAAYAVRHEKGASPVIFIDYLQLLAPRSERDTDKQAADFNVSELRRLARDMQAPVVAISSLNRASYSGNIEMESFKESGGIEYGADLLIGLQPYHIEEQLDAGAGGKDAREKRAKDLTKEYRTQSVRKSELVILKNRNGYIPREPLPLTFHAASSLFVEGV